MLCPIATGEIQCTNQCQCSWLNSDGEEKLRTHSFHTVGALCLCVVTVIETVTHLIWAWLRKTPVTQWMDKPHSMVQLQIKV